MLKHGFYNVAAAVIRLVLSLLAVPLLIRVIGVEEYGLWTVVSAVIGLAGLAEAGLSISTTVFVSRDLANDDADGISQTLTVTFGAILLLAVVAALLLWGGAPSLAHLFPALGEGQRHTAAQAFRAGALVVWARLVQQVLIGVEQAYQCYGLMNILNTAQAVAQTAGLVAVAWLGGRVLELMQWQAATSVVLLLVHLWSVWSLTHGVNLRPLWNRGKARTVASYSLKTMVGALSGALFSQCDRLVVAAFLGTRVVGVYGAITSIAVQVNSFSALPIQPLLPALSRLLATKGIDPGIIKQRVQQAVQLNALAAVGMGGILFAFAPVIVRLMIPEALNAQYVLAFQISTVIYTLFSINGAAYYILLGADEVGICMVLQFASAISSLALIAIGASSFGLLGAVAGNIGSLVTWMMLVFSMRRLDISAKAWGRWIFFPVSWFFAVLITGTITIHSPFVSLALFFVQATILLGWFTVNYHQELQALYRVFLPAKVATKE